MTITFENDSDVIVYALEKVISFARENQYLFVANCAWWLAGILGLDSGLTIFIDNLESRKYIHRSREISSIPKDIARIASVDLDQINIEEEIIQQRSPSIASIFARTKLAESNYISDPLGRTRKGKTNPVPQSKTQLKKARRRLKKAQQAKHREGIQQRRLEELRAQIINNL